MLTQAEFKQHTVELEETCQVHGVHLMQLDRVVHINGEDKPRKPSPFCALCNAEQREREELELSEQQANASLYAKTYYVLERESTNKDMLKKATLVFDGFVTKTREEEQMLVFAQNQAQKYLDGMVGNTVFTGGTGIGKTHVAIAMAKAINEGYKVKRHPKSVLFVNLTVVLREIRASNFALEVHYSKLLKGVDYLVLDDLGVKMSNPNSKAKSTWEEEFIFDVLSARENTIITTNLDNEGIKNLYSERVASRVRTGLKGNLFKSFTITDKRHNLRELEAEAQAQLAQRNQERTKNF